MNPYVYIVVRKDIKECNYAPQIAHAALEAGYAAIPAGFQNKKKTHVVILQVKSKMELEMVAVALEQEGIYFQEFHEGFANMGLTAIATLPTVKLEDSCLQTLELFSYEN